MGVQCKVTEEPNCRGQSVCPSPTRGPSGFPSSHLRVAPPLGPLWAVPWGSRRRSGMERGMALGGEWRLGGAEWVGYTDRNGGWCRWGSTRQWQPSRNTHHLHNPGEPASLWRCPPHSHRATALNGRKFPPARIWDTNPNVCVSDPFVPTTRPRLFVLSRIRIPGTSVAYPSCMPVCLREWGEAVAETT